MILQGYLVVSVILFVLGVICMVTRKNVVHLLMGLELILNAANLNLVAFSRFVTGNVEGQVATIFVIIIAVAEVSVALSIVFNIYRQLKDVHVDHIDLMRQ